MVVHGYPCQGRASAEAMVTSISIAKQKVDGSNPSLPTLLTNSSAVVATPC